MVMIQPYYNEDAKEAEDDCYGCYLQARTRHMESKYAGHKGHRGMLVKRVGDFGLSFTVWFRLCFLVSGEPCLAHTGFMLHAAHPTCWSWSICHNIAWSVPEPWQEGSSVAFGQNLTERRQQGS